jgi:hypothetical protein
VRSASIAGAGGAILGEMSVGVQATWSSVARSDRARRVRPVSPIHPQITQAIHAHVKAALTGSVMPEQALERAQREIEAALSGF